MAWVLARGGGGGGSPTRIDPEAALGAWGRYLIAGVLGFRLGGMSATFGGWATGPALGAALAGAVALVVTSVVLRPRGEV